LQQIENNRFQYLLPNGCHPMITNKLTLEVDRTWAHPPAGGPCAQVHGSSLVATAEGLLVCCWFGGSREGKPDTAIWGARETVPGTWAEPVMIADVGPTPHWNPVLSRDPALPTDAPLRLVFKIGPHPIKWHSRQGWLDPVSMSLTTPRAVPGRAPGTPADPALDRASGEIPPDLGPVRSKPIRTSSGTWLAPASVESKQEWYARIDRSTDGGATWSAGHPIRLADRRGLGIIQPVLFLTQTGNPAFLARSTEGVAFMAQSTDDGQSWSMPVASALPNNNAGFDIERLQQGPLLLAYNPVSGDWAARTPLSLALSINDGVQWQPVVHLETARAEFSYPALCRAGAEMAISYTAGRIGIRIARLRFAG
jgi:predicted neuraminidase